MEQKPERKIKIIAEGKRKSFLDDVVIGGAFIHFLQVQLFSSLEKV